MERYKELQDPRSCFNKAREDELLFVLLGRDEAAPSTIRAWIRLRLELGLNESGDAQLVEAEMLANKMEESGG